MECVDEGEMKESVEKESIVLNTVISDKFKKCQNVLL